MTEVVVEEPEEVIKIKTREKDEEMMKVMKEMKKVRVRNLRGNEWKIEGDLVLKEGKVYMPKNEKLRIEIIQLHHDVPVAGHWEDRR